MTTKKQIPPAKKTVKKVEKPIVHEKQVGAESAPTQKQTLEKIAERQNTIIEKLVWIDRLVKPMAVLMLCWALLTAASSIKCNIVPIPPNPIPNPSPNPNPTPDTDTQKAIDICIRANGMNTTHTYNQRLVWASQEIVRELGWPTEKAVTFAQEYVTNY